MGSLKGSDWDIWTQSPAQERQELVVFSSIFVRNEKVFSDLAVGEPAFGAPVKSTVEPRRLLGLQRQPGSDVLPQVAE